MRKPRRNKKTEKFIKILNIFLFFSIILFGTIFLVVSMEKNKKSVLKIERSLIASNKETTMISKELKIKKSKESKELDVKYREDPTYKRDPDLEYAIKLFELNINKKIKNNFKKPFNYKENSSCEVNFKLNENKYKLKNCIGDEIFKRSLSLAINKTLPVKKLTYNKINLKKEKIVILIRME